jgi:hypothetical protein
MPTSSSFDRLAPLAVLDGLREGVEIIDVSKIPRRTVHASGGDQRRPGQPGA